MGLPVLVRALIISIVALQFSFQPLAMAKQAENFNGEIQKRVAAMQKSGKPLTLEQLYKKNLKNMSPEARLEMAELVRVYGSAQVPKVKVVPAANQKDGQLVLLMEGPGFSTKMDITNDHSQFVKVNGQNFATWDLANLKVFADKFAKAYPDKKALAKNIASFSGARRTLTLSEIKALSVEGQGKYLAYLRGSLMAAEKVLNAKRKVSAAEKSFDAQQMLLELLQGPEAFAGAEQVCVVAGGITKYGKNRGGVWSCGGDPIQEIVPAAMQRNCASGQVKCSNRLFRDPADGKELCVKIAINSTQLCDHANPVKDKDSQKKLAKAVVGDLTEEGIKKFNDEYNAALDESIAACRSPESGVMPDQQQACQILESRRFNLGPEDIEAVPTAVDAKDEKKEDKPVAAAGGSKGGYDWLIPSGIILAMILGGACIVWFCNSSAGKGPQQQWNTNNGGGGGGGSSGRLDSGSGSGGMGTGGRTLNPTGKN